VSGGKFRAVLFDLLTGLIDSWTLWDSVAGNREDGRRWRAAYLQNTYAEGRYRPYEALVREAAVESGLPPELGDRLAARYDELSPWPEATEILSQLQGIFSLGIVTNCSEALGRLAVSRTGIEFDAVVTAERAASTSRIPDRICWRWKNSASLQTTLCSSPVRPMICPAPPRSECRCSGTTGSAWRCRPAPRRRWCRETSLRPLLSLAFDGQMPSALR
jgi:hypothetical protein